MEAAAAPGGQAPSEEVLFLIVQALAAAEGPLAQLGAAVAAAATDQGLLPHRRDIHGAPARLPHLPLQHALH